jgi:hypothetical protein
MKGRLRAALLLGFNFSEAIVILRDGGLRSQAVHCGV